MIYSTFYNSPIGEILLAERDNELIGLWIHGQYYYSGLPREEILNKETPTLTQTTQWLDRYFKGEKPHINDLKLSISGSIFRMTVLKLICDIPYGETVTYGEISKKVATLLGKDRMSAQAIGGAVGHNRIPIIIPCHRVVGSAGNLTGYGGGISIKIRLLMHEGVDMSLYYLPKNK